MHTRIHAYKHTHIHAYMQWLAVQTKMLCFLLFQDVHGWDDVVPKLNHACDDVHDDAVATERIGRRLGEQLLSMFN